jgi:hypothetical protein
MPVSSSTVETQIELEPDIGGVSAGSMMIQAALALVLGRDEQIDVPEHTSARLLQNQIAQCFVRGDEA